MITRSTIAFALMCATARAYTPEEIATVFSRTFGLDLVNPAPPAAKQE